MPFDRNIRDANLEVSATLPNGAATTYTSADIDLAAAGVHHAEVERVDVEVRVPALTTGEIPDTRTLTITLYQGATASPTTPVSASRVITGAGGVGAAKTFLRFHIHPNAGRYVRAQFVGGTSFGNASAKSAFLALTF